MAAGKLGRPRCGDWEIADASRANTRIGMHYVIATEIMF